MKEVSKKEDETLRSGKCPDCGGDLLRGPRGGLCINVKCEDCGAEFNMTPPPFLAERIGATLVIK